MKTLNRVRCDFWRYVVRKVFKIPEGSKLPFILRMIGMLVCPSRLWRINPAEYNSVTDVFTIYGIKYSGDLFRAWGKHGIVEGTVFELIKRDDNMVILKVIK